MRGSAFDPEAAIRDVRLRLDAARARCAGRRPTLFAYDANAIQAFLTASRALPYLRGASERVKAFDKAVFDDNPGCLFAGGGRGLMLVTAEEAARLADELPAEYRKQTHGSLAVAVAPLGDDEGAALKWLRLRMVAAKDGAVPPVAPERSPHMCDDCRVRPARRQRRRGEDRVVVCDLCDAIIDLGHGARDETEVGRTLADLSSLNRLAVLAADGNEMGRLFASLERLDHQAVVSRAVSSVFEEARREALSLSGVGEDGYVSPVAGGDDVVIFFGPEHAFDVVGHLVEKLERRVDALADALGLPAEAARRFRGIGLGIGLVIGPDHFPASRLLQAAHELEKSAKRICRGDGFRSAIDFAYLRSGDEALDTSNVNRRSRIGLSTEEGPTRNWERLLRRAQALQQVPTSQRAMLRVRPDPEDPEAREARNLFRYQVAREDAWRSYIETAGGRWTDPDDAVDHMPAPHELDLARLLDLVARRKEERP